MISRALSVLALAGVWALMLLAAGPAPASAQVAVTETEARYLEARAELDEVRVRIESVRPGYSRLVEQLRSAREAGDDRRAEELFREFVEPSWQMSALTLELEDRMSDFREARREFIRALEVRMEDLLDRLEDPDLPEEEETRLNRLFVETSQQYFAVQRERDPVEEAMLRPLPTFPLDERDGPQELRDKAAYLESEVAGDYEAVIEFTTREIEARESQLRMERAGADFRADLSRFDTDRLPGTGAGAGAGVVRPDDEVTVLDGPFVFADFSLPEQIEILRSIRAQAEQARDETLQRAELFRARAEGRE
jgi:hypothetical protein